jgi:hypothetical protein
VIHQPTVQIIGAEFKAHRKIIDQHKLTESGGAVSNQLKSVADATLQFLVPMAELLAAGDSDVLSTIREQKHLLHHWSHCRYRRRSQSAPPVLAQG